MMASIVLAQLIAAFLAVLGKLVTQSFFEAVLSKVIVWSAEKLAPMTTNTLDDQIVAEIKTRLEK